MIATDDTSAMRPQPAAAVQAQLMRVRKVAQSKFVGSLLRNIQSTRKEKALAASTV